MGTEDDDRFRELWRNVSRRWYKKALARSPESGRICHHLALVAPRHSLEQLFLYLRSLTCVAPYERMRKDIKTIFNPKKRSPLWEKTFIYTHTLLSIGKVEDFDRKFNALVDVLAVKSMLDNYIVAATGKLSNVGALVAISNIAALFEYGAPNARLSFAYRNAQMAKNAASRSESRNPEKNDSLANEEATGSDSNWMIPLDHEDSSFIILRSSSLTSTVLKVWLNRETDRDTHCLIHTYLVFIWSLVTAQEAWKPFEKETVWRNIEKSLPWFLICQFLNTVALSTNWPPKIFSESFPESSEKHSDMGMSFPLPEDFLLQGQIYSQWYFPSTWFTETTVGDGEDHLELRSTTQTRLERILWLGHRIASVCRTSVRQMYRTNGSFYLGRPMDTIQRGLRILHVNRLCDE